MAHHDANEQPGLEVHEQAGLEVVSEPEAPHVVNGPTVFGKPFDQTQQQHQNYAQYGGAATSPYHEYPQYPQSPPYANSPVHPPQSQWAPSQVGTLGPSASEKGAPEATILGIKRRKFWLIFGPLLAVLVIGLSVGLGVGLGTSHSSSSTSAASSSSATATSSTATATATVSAITCPSSNGSYYLTSDDTKFLVLCNLDYNQGGGTEDISNPVTNTVEDCATTCANNGTCAGAGWGEYYGTTYCWMKSYLGTSQSAPNWYFLIKQ
ncbi:hypothetical protein E8E14_009781 [Neopestalotiopsis sp. 37M]|nr:hypothetical protein E8E14_009781 [Neopestalotiopsis sp. 37M]